MSYLKTVHQISRLVTPDRYLAQMSALVEKEEVSASYVHNLDSDERHAGSIKHRPKLIPCWKAPLHVGPEVRVLGDWLEPGQGCSSVTGDS